ncbi:DUF4444 domain-containing protein [Defluviimonas sp. WL0002]|uniref:DUF4444 domain-containing protein n=1 Tax=Albidovulum marisflavi TaxID=2984159 RepID=A0ABT2ZDL0_9RHOB|nr:biotin/lipoate--protein ligase family protein [Defluviimonas sp. WL0002]MCV2869235.1 DUF4444 domain-containing protein [Defluviimonas sp. WL0002]
MSRTPVFPPLMKGLAAGPANPFVIACDQARRGVDAGLIAWSVSNERLRAALVLAPEEPLEKAMVALIACGVGFQNAFGALAPSETALHLEWAGGIRVNGAHCGALHVGASTADPTAVPGWLVVALDLTLSLPDEWEPGETPDWTAIDQEGCGQIDPIDLLESWSRHTLRWINTLEDPDGRSVLARDWQGLAWNLGSQISLAADGIRLDGTFLGVDENFGMLLKTGGETRLIPLTALLEEV